MEEENYHCHRLMAIPPSPRHRLLQKVFLKCEISSKYITKQLLTPFPQQHLHQCR
jgi:hypothetical protein